MVTSFGTDDWKGDGASAIRGLPHRRIDCIRVDDAETELQLQLLR